MKQKFTGISAILFIAFLFIFFSLLNHLSLNEKNLVYAKEYTYPSSLDWRNKDGKDWTTPIKDQTPKCDGSCWAFASASFIESKIKIATNNPYDDIDLSEQSLLSCCGKDKCGNCYFGYTEETMEYIKNTGILYESCLPYEANDEISCNEKCNDWEKKIVKIKYEKIEMSEKAIKQAINDYGPVILEIYARDDFFNYKGGIYKGKKNYKYKKTDRVHIINIIGYNDDEEYWICKNSWGSKWGEDGYCRISYSENRIDYEYEDNDESEYLRIKNPEKGIFLLDTCYAITDVDISPNTDNKDNKNEKKPKNENSMTEEIIIEITADYYYSIEQDLDFTILGENN